MVCVGNICRSPTAEAVLRDRLDGTGIAVESAGLAALSGKPIHPLAEAVLGEHGGSGASHVARQIDRRLIDEAGLILVMERKHLQAIDRIAPHARGKTFLLGKWQGDVEIPDPYRRERHAYEHAFRLIDESIARWRPHLSPR
nr:low molecular weight protein-tyrosine-phosphatase [Luteimonas salinisoli]